MRRGFDSFARDLCDKSWGPCMRAQVHFRIPAEVSSTVGALESPARLASVFRSLGMVARALTNLGSVDFKTLERRVLHSVTHLAGVFNS